MIGRKYVVRKKGTTLRVLKTDHLMLYGKRNLLRLGLVRGKKAKVGRLPFNKGRKRSTPRLGT